MLGPKKDKCKVCPLLDKTHTNFGSSAAWTANSAKLLDIKTEVRALCGTILMSVFEILSKLGFWEEKSFSFCSDNYKNWDISHIWNKIITEKNHI